MKEKSITICGSTKFRDVIDEINTRLALKGKLVLSITPAKNLIPNENQKQILGLIHMNKIMVSEAIIVSDVNGYIGTSTQEEINRARNIGIPVYFGSQIFPDLCLTHT